MTAQVGDYRSWLTHCRQQCETRASAAGLVVEDSGRHRHVLAACSGSPASAPATGTGELTALRNVLTSALMLMHRDCRSLTQDQAPEDMVDYQVGDLWTRASTVPGPRRPGTPTCARRTRCPTSACASSNLPPSRES